MDGVTVIGVMVTYDKPTPSQTCYHYHGYLKGFCYGSRRRRRRAFHIKVKVLSKIDLIELKIITFNCSACSNLWGGFVT